MANDLDTLSAGELQLYNPGQPLAPMSHDSWANTDIDLLTERGQYPPSSGPQLFGVALPPGTTDQQVQATLSQLGGAFMADMGSLGYPAYMINAAIQFMTANAAKAPYQVQVQHNFNLHGQDDWLGNAFGNMVQTLSGSPRAKQQFVTVCLGWLAKTSKQLNGQTEGSVTAPRMASNSEDPTANLTDQQYQQLVEHNNRVQAQTLQTLQQRWGSCFKINIELAQAQLDKLTPAELQHLDRYTGSWPWTHMFNTVELLTHMYEASIGAHSIGTSGADIAREIAAFESMLKIPSERQKYMRDPQMQARLRELYERRG